MNYGGEDYKYPCFVGATTYSGTFQNWGASPAMKPKKENPTFINMKIAQRTTYKDTFAGGKELLPQFVRDHEQQMKTSFLKKMTQGSLAYHVSPPFEGKTVTQMTYKQPHAYEKLKLSRPFDEVSSLLYLWIQLFVASLPMRGDSEFNKEYDGKTVDRCKYYNAKSKPVFG